MKEWTCGVCGYVHKEDTPPQKCPVCGAGTPKFSATDDDRIIPELESLTQASPSISNQTVRQWRCSVCGYIHKGVEPPDKCPVCGAPKSKFVLVQEEKPASGKSQGESSPITPSLSGMTNDTAASATQAPKTTQSISPYEELFKKLSKLHAHPISVHIPNGVLPLTVLFTFLAFIFDAKGLAIAARYNMIFVCLTMPIVVTTGLIDWRIRFGQRLSKVFKTKMVCAGIVTFLSLVLAVWWCIQPGIYSGQAAHTGFFLFLNLANLAAAVIAGWYGGKLVFPGSGK